MSDFRWAIVTAVSPLRVKLDGDTAALPFTLDSLIDPLALAVSDRVRCELTDNRVIVHGQANDSHYSRAEVAALIAAGRGRKNRVINGRFRTNQRAYVSGASLAAGAYGFDRWKGSGITNLFTNPSFETNTTGATPDASATLSRVTTDFYTRTASLRYQINTTGTASCSANFAVSGLTVGRQYTVSAYVKNASGARPVRIDLLGGVAGSTLTPTSTWQRLVLSFAATATSHTVIIWPSASGASGDAVFIDGMIFTEGTLLWPYHDGSSAESVWTGTADASTSRRGPSSGLATFTALPQGQTITLASGAGIMQVLERADMVAATYCLSFAGTATGRIYNAGTLPSNLPAFAASGSMWVLDGLDDVVVEFTAVGGTKTVDNAQLEIATAPTAFEYLPLAEELAICQRYYMRWGDADYANIPLFGMQVSTTISRVRVIAGIKLRALPAVTFSNICISDHVAFEASVSAIAFLGKNAASNVSTLGLEVTHAAAGASRYPVSSYVRNAAGGFLALDAEL